MVSTIAPEIIEIIPCFGFFLEVIQLKDINRIA
jgi:hypothetical protein